MNRMPAALTALALAVRALVAWRTAMPERDAAHYLWMADGMVLGAPERLFDSVFHPVFPALIGALRLLWPAADPVVAGQIVACTFGALATWPRWILTARCFGARGALATGLCFALGTWFVRHPADVLSEGVFHLFVAATACIIAGRPRGLLAAAAGLLVALAYGTRPEGAILAPCALAWLLLGGQRRAAGAFAIGAGAGLSFPIGWALYGPGFTLSPKAAFVWADGVGADRAGLAHYVHHLLLVPGSAVEAIGFIVAPAALAGVVIALRTRGLRVATALLVPLLIQCAMVPMLRSNHRFLSGYGILLLPFAGLVWQHIEPWLRARGRIWVGLAALVVFAPDLVRLPVERRSDRVVERELGAWLGAQLRAGDRLVSTLQRVDYFAGVEPAPPRTITPAELESALADSHVRFVVWAGADSGPSATALDAAGMRSITPPAAFAQQAERRGLSVFGR